MTTLTIEQAKGMVGTVIPRIQAKLTKVYERKTGKGQFGEWSLQNGEIQDDSGVMKILFKQLPSQEHLQGKTMIFKSMEGKHGLKGVECKKNEYKGKTTLELHVSNAALIVGNGEETITEPVETTRMPQIEPPMASEGTVSHETRKLGIVTAKTRLTQLAGLYDLCWKTVGSMDMHSALDPMDCSLQKDISTTLFIQACRENLSDKMPVRTLSKFYNEEAIKPASAQYRGDPAEQEEMENDLHESDRPF